MDSPIRRNRKTECRNAYDNVSGAFFPDYELTDHSGKRRKLSELQGQDPMVFVLSRGSFCPKDRRQHEVLVQLHRELEVGYCRLVMISTDNHLQDYWFFGRPTVEDPESVFAAELY
jgi:AhpC/TSA family